MEEPKKCFKCKKEIKSDHRMVLGIPKTDKQVYFCFNVKTGVNCYDQWFIENVWKKYEEENNENI